MLAKNLMQLMLFALELAMVSGIVWYRFGMPDPAILTVTLCWLLFALPLQLTAGNLLSLTMAYRMTLTRMAREEGAAGNGLLSMLVQLVILGAGAAVYVPLRMNAGMAACIFLVLAALSCAAWLRVYTSLDRMASRRREALISAVARMG
jgi:hypothetical protein